MLVVETIAKIRRAYFSQGKAIKEICRELRVSRKVVRKVIRSNATEFHYERSQQPLPRIGPWRERLEALLDENDGRAARERLTLIRIFEELRALGYAGSYAAVRRYAIAWREKRAGATAAAYVPLTFAPGEAYQFDSHGGPRVKSFCWSRVRFCRTAVSMGTSGFDPSGRFRPVRYVAVWCWRRKWRARDMGQGCAAPAKPAYAKRMSLTRVSSSRRKCLPAANDCRTASVRSSPNSCSFAIHGLSQIA
jgi:hypothetical protein